MAGRSVLIVGCGFIGLPFARLARDAGWKVYATTRKRERFAELEAEGLTPVQWNIFLPTVEELAAELIRSKSRRRKKTERLTVPGEWFGELPEVDVALYAVGQDRSAERPSLDAYLSGLNLTLTYLERRTKFIYASSTGVYGDAAGDWIDESATPAPSDASSSASLRTEQLLHANCDLVRRDYCILRFAGLYGPGRLISAAALQRGEPIPSDGDAWLNLVHRDDAASALLAAVERGKDREIYNIADGHPALRRDFYLKLADLLNAPPPTFAPELARRHRGNRRIYAGKARTELGWSPRYPSYIEGLEAIARETG